MFLITLLFLISAITLVLTCNDLEMVPSYIRNCAGINSVIKLNRMNISLDNNCYLISTGLRSITKDYETAQATLNLERSNGQKHNLRINACKPLGSNPMILKVFNLLSVPLECPVKKGKQKLQNKQDLSLILKNSMSLALGQTNVKINIQHDNGISCIEANYNLRKK